MLGHVRSETLDRFKEAFGNALNEGKGFHVAASDCAKYFMSQFDVASADMHIGLANWESSKVREELRHDIEAHIAAVRAAKLSELATMYETKLNDALAGPVVDLLDKAGDDTWPGIRKLLCREAEPNVSEFSRAISGFGIADIAKDKMLSRLKDYARGVVETRAKEAAKGVLMRMKDRFFTIFSYGSNSRKEEILAIAKTARSASLKLLSVMAAVRLDDKADSIEDSLYRALMGPESGAAASRSISGNPLTSSSWDEIPPSKTLLTPAQCASLWSAFLDGTDTAVKRAIDTASQPRGSPSPDEPTAAQRLVAVAIAALTVAEAIRGRPLVYYEF